MRPAPRFFLSFTISFLEGKGIKMKNRYLGAILALICMGFLMEAGKVGAELDSSFRMGGQVLERDGDFVTLVVNWQPLLGATHYQVAFSESEDMSNPVLQMETEDNFAQLADLEPGGSYFWNVTAFFGEGQDPVVARGDPKAIIVPASARKRPTAEVPRGTATLDGILEEEWKDAQKLLMDRMLLGQWLTELPYPEVYLMWDEKALYIAGRAWLPENESFELEPAKRDSGVHETQALEVFLAGQESHLTYQCLVNAAGTVYDQKNGDVSWDGQWERAVRTEGKEMVIEIAVPFEGFGFQGKKGERIGANFVFDFAGQTRAPGWATITPPFFQPKKFGILVLK